VSIARVSDIAGGYRVAITVTAVLAAGFQILLKADPSRYFVRFDMITGIVTNQFVVPAGNTVTIPGPSFANLPRAAKFSEEPGAVGGEWYIFASGGEQILIEEILQLG